jgi:3-deoxy-D-manno-octulosonate 8-phosphate phosphatase (KDO 8-P phosphatase)
MTSTPDTPTLDSTQPALLILDVDGVLTDGRVTYDSGGAETKTFHIRDGLGIKLAQRVGIEVAILTARVSPMVARRAAELGIEHVQQGFENKVAGLDELLERLGIESSTVAYMGDDLLDLPAMRRVGYRLAPADAVAEVRELAEHVTQRPGGHGAVREAVEHLLRRADLYDRASRDYLGHGG